MKVVLLSTYELGRQPFGLASPAAWLRSRGHQTTCADLALEALPEQAIREAGLAAFYLPMHTATRLAARAITRVRKLNPGAHLAAYGLYAPLSAEHLRSLGVRTFIGGEFEPALADLADGLAAGYSPATPALAQVPLERLQFLVPDRAGLPALHRYAKLIVRDGERTVGYTEASRGCKHLCRHCPIVPVYQGAFRVVQPDVVLGDIRSQVEAGARHITFGDPDFFNGPRHALRIVEALHRDFPGVTYDVTIKVEHLLQNRAALSVLRDTGCLFITSAVESVDDAVLEKLAKGHTRRDFYEAAGLCRSTGVLLNPTFIAFLPWTTRAGYLDLLSVIRELDLIAQVSPIQLALRLLIPFGSRILELADVREIVGGFDPAALAWKWSHPDPAVDQLAHAALATVSRGRQSGNPRHAVFADLWHLAAGEPLPGGHDLLPRAAIPYLNEPWYC